MSAVEYHSASVTPSITISPAAIKHIVSHLLKQNDACGMRLAVKKTGCSGLAYVVDYVKEFKQDDWIVPLENGYAVYIDRVSIPYLNGVHVDYVQHGLNYKFIFTNPNQTGQCGCGESFTVKE